MWKTLSCLGVLLAVAACDDGAAKPSAECDHALAQAKQKLGALDVAGAKEWTGRAKGACAPAQSAEIASVEQRLAAIDDAKAKDVAKANAKVPPLVAAVKSCLDDKDRAACKDEEGTGTCPTSAAGPMSAQCWTAKGDRGAFSAFATLGARGVTCEAFGKTKPKAAKGTAPSRALHCAIEDGPLASLEVLIKPNEGAETTDVYVFTPPWVDRDPELAAKLTAVAAP
jgi:hypothetical protein